MSTPIFQTMSKHDGMVDVTLETVRGGALGIVARDYTGRPVMGLPVAHASKAILSTMFDDTDTAAILARIAD